jgi:hypothetical protein
LDAPGAAAAPARPAPLRSLRPTLAVPAGVVAAVAERHHVTLLHYDAGYDLITAVTGQAAEWVAPQGTLP